VAPPVNSIGCRNTLSVEVWDGAIGSVGDSYDNALAESVVGLYKAECVKIGGPFKTVDELELATLSWVHWFNESRPH